MPTPTPLFTPDTNALLQQQLDQLSEGQIGYDEVPAATVDIPFTLRAFVIDTSSVEAVAVISETLERDAPPDSVPRVQPIRVSGLMRVRLVAQDPRDFEITAHTEERQLVGGADPTNWSWVVRPLRAGRDKKLELRVIAIARLPDTGEEVTKELPPQTITLSINVNPGYTARTIFTDYGWLLFLLLVISVGSYVYLRSRNRRTATVSAPGPRGLSADLYERLRLTLLRCGPFASDADLRALFIDDRLSPWRDDIPQANTPAARVRALVAYLYNQYTETGENALLLFLHVLAENTDPADGLHITLTTLAADLVRALEERSAD